MFDTHNHFVSISKKKIITNMTLIFISDAAANLINFYVFNLYCFYALFLNHDYDS